MNSKGITALAVLVVLVVGGYVLMQGSPAMPTERPTETVSTTQNSTGNRVPQGTGAATGNPDDLLAAMFAETETENALLSDSAEDVALVVSDSQALSDFGSTYDETAL